uniref:Uncharacterized protein n=1 Tax=viral metagenome TaxID=1070528 RepID=A0A6C0F0B5_9ZZZZ
MSVVSQVIPPIVQGGKTTFKSLNPYSPGIKYTDIPELIAYLCMFAQFDGWHDHKNFKNIVELVNAYTPGDCKAISDAQARPRVHVSEDVFLQTMLKHSKYIGFHRPKFTDNTYINNSESFFVSSSGAYIQKTPGQLRRSILEPPPPPPPASAPPPPKMTACCYVLNDADVSEIYSDSVSEKYHVAHIIVDASAGDDSDREGFNSFSLLQYCFAGLLGITDDIYILRDVAKSNFGVSCNLFGTDWREYMAEEEAPPMPLNQRVIALNTGAVFYDPGPTLNPTTGAGKAHGFNKVGSKSLCGVCIGTEVVQYPKFIDRSGQLNSEDTIGILMYSKYDMELSTEGFSVPNVGVTNVELARRFANVKSTLNIHDDTHPTKKLVYSVTRDDSNKETDSSNVPILDVISNAFRNGRNVITTSGPKKVASKKVGDSGIQLYTSQPSIEHMLIEPEGTPGTDATTYKLTPSISNGIHASVTYDLGAFKIGLKYGNPISILNMPNGFLLCVSKELVAKYSNPAQKMQNANNRLESLKRIFEETKAKRIIVRTNIGAMRERYEDIKDLLVAALTEIGQIATKNDKTYQHVLSIWYLFTPILKLIKSIDDIPQDEQDVDATLDGVEESRDDAYWAPSSADLDDLTELNGFISVKELELSTYKSLLSNRFSLHEMYKNVDELFQGIITRFNIKKPAFSVNGRQFLPYYLGTYEDDSMVAENKEDRKATFSGAFTAFARNAEDIIGIVTKPSNSPKIRDAAPYKFTSGKLSLRAFTMCMDHADLDYFNNETISHIVSNLGQDMLGSFKAIMNAYFEDVKTRASNPKESNVRDCLQAMREKAMREKIPAIIDEGSQLLAGGMRGGAYLDPGDEVILETIRKYIYVFLLIKSTLLINMPESDKLITEYINPVINEAYGYLKLHIPRIIDDKYIESLSKWKEGYVSTLLENEDDDGRMFTYIPEGINTKEILDYMEFKGQETFGLIDKIIGDFNNYIHANKSLIKKLKIKRLYYYCDDYSDMQLIDAEIDAISDEKDVDILLAIDEILIRPPSLVRASSSSSEEATQPAQAPQEMQLDQQPLAKSVTMDPDERALKKVKSSPLPKALQGNPMDRSASEGGRATRKNTKTKNKKTKTKSKNPKVKSKNKTKKRLRLKPMKISIGTPKASD